MDEFYFKEMRTWGQSKISSYCFCVWCESGELRGRGSPRFPCVTPMVESFSSDRVAFGISSNMTMELHCKTANDLNTLTVFVKKLYHRLPTGFQMRIWPEVLWMWGVGELKVHGIRSRRLVSKEVVEARSNYKKSYVWWFGNPVYGDSTGSNLIEEDQGPVSTRLVWGKREEGALWYSACGASSDDWANGGYDDKCGECGFGSLGSWSYSHDWVLNLGDKNYVALVQGSEMSAGWYSRNSMLDIYCCGKATFTVYLWPNG